LVEKAVTATYIEVLSPTNAFISHMGSEVRKLTGPNYIRDDTAVKQQPTTEELSNFSTPTIIMYYLNEHSSIPVIGKNFYSSLS
jgi:hypothetical protein